MSGAIDIVSDSGVQLCKNNMLERREKLSLKFVKRYAMNSCDDAGADWYLEAIQNTHAQIDSLCFVWLDMLELVDQNVFKRNSKRCFVERNKQLTTCPVLQFLHPPFMR